MSEARLSFDGETDISACPPAVWMRNARPEIQAIHHCPSADARASSSYLEKHLDSTAPNDDETLVDPLDEAVKKPTTAYYT